MCFRRWPLQVQRMSRPHTSPRKFLVTVMNCVTSECMKRDSRSCPQTSRYSFQESKRGLLVLTSCSELPLMCSGPTRYLSLHRTHCRIFSQLTDLRLLCMWVWKPELGASGMSRIVSLLWRLVTCWKLVALINCITDSTFTFGKISRAPNVCAHVLSAQWHRALNSALCTRLGGCLVSVFMTRSPLNTSFQLRQLPYVHSIVGCLGPQHIPRNCMATVNQVGGGPPGH
jgi:hypothetical protein